MTSPYVIDYCDSFDLPVPPGDVWASVQDAQRFESWWSWLHDFRIEGSGLVAGAVLHGVVEPPLPYRMRLWIELHECVPPQRVDASVHGDLEGCAQLRLEPRGDGTRATVAWTIEMMQRPMRVAARLGHPVLRWGHDRVVDATVAGFRRHLASPRTDG